MRSLSLPLSVPDDVALKIASLLQVPDLCALASCSRFWREICGSDCIWEPLVRDRWPPLEFSDGSSSSTAIKKTMSMGWRPFYIEVHHKMAAEATSVVQFVKQCRSSESLEVDEYLGAIELLHAMRFGLEDIEMFLFKSEHTVLLNMIGLHYCIDCLGVPDTPMTTRWKEEKAESPRTLKSNAFSFQSRKQSKMSPLPVPEDIALQIASFLQVPDLCSLASCSRLWRELCGSDCIWESLVRDRWPSLELSDGPSSSSAIKKPMSMGWRCFYMELHNEKAARATSVVQFVETCSSSVSLEVGEYQKAMQDLHALQFGYQDVQMFLFKPELTVLVNLLGLHYCMNWLGVPANCVLKALESRKISERQVCVKWWKLGRWSHGFRMRDELLSRRFTLIDAGLAKQEEVLAVLHRGAIHEVLRVQICVADPSSPSWSCQSADRRV